VPRSLLLTRSPAALALAAIVSLTAACASARVASPVREPATAAPADPAPRPPALRSEEGRLALATVARRGAIPDADLGYLMDRELMVPVKGIRARRIPDSFDDPRGGRRHNAVDILAPRGTPVLSADEGRIYRLRRNAAGGITVYAVDPEERFVYYYAHLDRYRDGLKEGMRLAKGEVIGYVGTTGNAPPDTPHLHFQVMRLTAAARYWDGVPVDPKPFFALDGDGRDGR
jgi:murein DD-endopeptidase MepM/ murein hydrolase activator NlpD